LDYYRGYPIFVYEIKTKPNQTKNLKPKFFVSLLFCILSVSAFSFPALTEINNCYQSIRFNRDPGLYNLLKGEFWFDRAGNPTTNGYKDFMTFNAYDINGLIVPLNLQSIGFTDVVNYPIYQNSSFFDFNAQAVLYGDVIRMNTNNVYNTQKINLPPNVTSFQVVILTPGGNSSDYTVDKTATINIVEQEDAFTFTNSNGRSCQTFDNFNMSYSEDLDGFCGVVKGNLRRLPADITDPNDPLNELNFVFGSQTDLSPWAEHCPGPDQVMIFEPRPNEPVPEGCQTFVVDLIIEPCSGSPAECEDLIISEEIEICCNCDARQPLPAH
jgi:hypothetical protein